MATHGRLISVELDGNGFAVEFEIDGHGRHRIENPVTASSSSRLQMFVITEILPDLWALPEHGVIIDPAEPNDPDEHYASES